jgi:hypothetical protein
MVGYNCLDRDNLFVSEGDEILPSTPLGLVGTYDGELYGVSVQNFWYITKSGTKNSEGREYATEYFFPRFATTEGIVVPEHDKIYTPVVTDEMMTCEMTRKERKEYLKNK